MNEIKNLNDLYYESCKLKCENYKKISNNITLIDNFFENFEDSKNFFTSREKWKCTSYQGNAKPGYETIFPNWCGKLLMEKYLFDNRIIYDSNSCEMVCNFFYHDDEELVWAISNSNYYPHIDSLQNGDILNYICLINLNSLPVSTNFYTYKNKKYCNNKIEFDEFDEYTLNMSDEIVEYYNKKLITRNEIKIFLNKKQKSHIKLIKSVEYAPNQAIVYAGNLFHSPNVTEEFDQNNLRSLIRINFDRKVTAQNKFNYS